MKLFDCVRLVLRWLAIKHMWSGSVVCSCLVIYNPIGSLKHTGQLVLCQSRLPGMDKPGWREIHNCSCAVCCQDILLPLCLYTLANKSFKHAHFYEARINHTDAVTGISSVTVDCHQSGGTCWQTNSSASIRSFSWDSFISCHVTLMFWFLSVVPFVFCLDYRRPSPVLTCVLHTACLMIPCLSEMRRTGNVSFLGRVNGLTDLISLSKTINTREKV